MDYKEAFRAGLQELILPELNRIRDDLGHVKSVLELTNKRLDDTNAHILDQSRRIDDLRTELTGQIQGLHDQLKQEIQDFRGELKQDNQYLRAELKQDNQYLRAELKQDYQDLREELKQDNQSIRSELRHEIQAFRTELKQEIQDFRSELKEDIRGLTHRLDTTNDRLDRMTMAMVRREEQERLFEKVSGLEMRVFRVEERIAA